MDHDELTFAEFLAVQMKDKGFSIKKLSEATGIASVHIENMLRGDLEDLPSAPYFHGYLVRIGKTLGFDSEEWWAKIKSAGGGALRNSGSLDALPRNRFVRRVAPKWLWLAIAAGVLIVIYLVIALPRILGRPMLAVVYPPTSPFVATSTTLTFRGTVRNADALYLSSGGSAGSLAGSIASAPSSEEIPAAADGTWQKTVLLQNGLNTFDISAKKFLGGEADLTEQVLYEPPTATSTTSTVTSTVSSGL